MPSLKISLLGGPFDKAVFDFSQSPRNCGANGHFADGEIIGMIGYDREQLYFRCRRDCPSKDVSIYLYESRDEYVDFYVFDHYEPTQKD